MSRQPLTPQLKKKKREQYAGYVTTQLSGMRVILDSYRCVTDEEVEMLWEMEQKINKTFNPEELNGKGQEARTNS